MDGEGPPAFLLTVERGDGGSRFLVARDVLATLGDAPRATPGSSFAAFAGRL
jgi:hypothetical protein